MSNEIKIKSNGLRNELKEIRKSIDTLTHALHIMIETQTHKRHERNNYTWDGVCGDDCECTSIKQKEICRDETGRSFGI